MVKRLVAIALCAAAMVGVSATGALAGEVKGPPGVINNTNETGALDHARSACAASGLNDFDLSSGQISSIVQTAADSFKYYGLPHGTPGTACRGNAG
jgi:hypothetical protein